MQELETDQQTFSKAVKDTRELIPPPAPAFASCLLVPPPLCDSMRRLLIIRLNLLQCCTLEQQLLSAVASGHF